MAAQDGVGRGFSTKAQRCLPKTTVIVELSTPRWVVVQWGTSETIGCCVLWSTSHRNCGKPGSDPNWISQLGALS